MQRLEFMLGVQITIESEQANGARAASVSTDGYVVYARSVVAAACVSTDGNGVHATSAEEVTSGLLPILCLAASLFL
jgi:hypothetical protein